VTVRITVAANGDVTNAEVSGSSGHDSLDSATIKCVMNGWHYKPAMQNGQPIEAVTEAKVLWKLQ
jgi:protein TonB